ncbi:flagellar assembly protein FliW [Demequina mangrovi]|uniref:Flagellar assembly factor FliW n=1 Tax=Demequina mangrovi TaxID=1043493 RepID=A0A1H7A3J6_9MICO|nr:flagellar assembly protein FliW [Demequina mangrovi]SEJ56602.1 flagellar assembly factor FliW [Demequina mangrovi]
MSVAVALDGARTDVRDLPETLTFVERMPGMADLTRFRLAAIDEAGFVFTLRSEDEAGVRLFAASPHAYFPTYEPAVPAEVREALGASPDAALVMLAIVNPGREEDPTTVNLLAPLVIDPTTGAAVQMVLDGDEWPLRAPLG